MADSETCFLCSRSPSDPARPVKVILRQDAGATTTTVSYKLLEVPVPACPPCRQAHFGAKRRVAVYQLAAIAGLTIVGWIAGRGQLAMLGFGAGFFISLGIGAVAGGKGRAVEYPKVKELLNSGWRFHAP